MTVECSTTVYIFLGTSQNEAPLRMTLDPAQTDTHTHAKHYTYSLFCRKGLYCRKYR